MENQRWGGGTFFPPQFWWAVELVFKDNVEFVHNTSITIPNVFTKQTDSENHLQKPQYPLRYPQR